MTELPPPGRAIRIIVAACSALAAGLGVFVLVCWAGGRWTPGQAAVEPVPMAPLTAGLLILSAGGLVLRVWRPAGAAGWITTASGAAAAVAGAWVGAQWYFGLQGPLSRWLGPTEMMPGRIPLGRVSPLTGAMFVLTGVGLILESWAAGGRRWCRQAACAGAMAVLGASLVVVLSYALNVPLLYDGRTVPMAVSTAMGLAILATGLLAAAGGDVWPARLLRTLWTPSPGAPRFRAARGPVAAALLMAAALTGIGFLFLRNQINEARQAAHNQLLAVADLKAGQIAQWRNQQTREAMASLAMPGITELVRAVSAGGPAGERAWNQLWAIVSAARDNFHYARVLLLDAQLRVVMSSPRGDTYMGPATQALAAGVLQKFGVVFGDLHESPLRHTVHIDIFLPLMDPSGPRGGQRAGVLIFEIDPEEFLYPALKSWPVPSRTAEAYLIRRDGDELVHLSPVRHRSYAPLTLRHRMPGDACSVEARAGSGGEGLIEGVDYRGQPVLGVVHAIADSPWLLVTKIDRAEVHAPLRQRVLTAGVLAMTLLVAGLLAIALLQRHRDTLWLRRQLDGEQALRESRQRFAALFDAMTEGVAIHELVSDTQGTPIDYRIVDVNPAYILHTGLSRQRAVGTLATSLYGAGAPPYLDVYARVARTGTPETFEVRFEPLARHFRVTAFRTAPGWFATVFEDITERRRLQEQLLQARKMEAIGQLAGGIAHEFRNQLTVIRGYSEMLIRRGLVAGDGAEKVREVIRAADRSADLTNQLLAFGRRQMLQASVVDLANLVEGSAGMLTGIMGEGVRVRIVVKDGPCPVRIDAAQFQQVLINLAANARDAMGGRGELLIEITRFQAAGAPQPCARVTISDTGRGMSPEVLAHLFEPFFTTKSVGEGTGLGLAMVYGFVQQSGGLIDVDSRPDAGTTFRLVFPLVADTIA